MKTRNSKTKAHAFLGAAFVLLIALVFTACKNNAGTSSGGGTPASPAASAHSYTKVKYDDLDGYLQNKASDTDINYIEVIELRKADLTAVGDLSPLGDTLLKNNGKKVALKLGGVSGVEDMSYCFYGCTSLVQVSALPEGVTNMSRCFALCTNLTEAPAIPESVTNMNGCFGVCTKLEGAVLKCNYNSAGNMFDNAFKGCTALKDGGIKVPAGQFAAYKAGADDMGISKDKFAAEP